MVERLLELQEGAEAFDLVQVHAGPSPIEHLPDLRHDDPDSQGGSQHALESMVGGESAENDPALLGVGFVGPVVPDQLVLSGPLKAELESTPDPAEVDVPLA